MPNLDELLAHTMFMQGARGFRAEKLEARNLAKPALPAQNAILNEASQIWHWNVNGDEPARIRDLTCLAAGMGNGRMTVCDEVAVEDVAVVSLEGQTINLPLSPSFIVRKHHLDGGYNSGSHSMYPLTGLLDKSLLYAFCYEFQGGLTSTPSKPSAATLASSDFIPSPQSAAHAMPVCRVGERLTVRAAPPRILVLVSFTTMRSKPNFEPGEILAAGRVNPHVLIVASVPLREVRATVKIARPPRMKMEGGDHSSHTEMNMEIESSLFADRNDAPELIEPGPAIGPPSPYWDDLFDLYRTGVSSGVHRAVDVQERGGVIPNAIASLTTSSPMGSTVWVKHYVPRDLRRVARQGTYDNIHIAPTMRSDLKPSGAPYFLDRVYMAPFCEHDCLHTHWRWSESADTQSARGWSDDESDLPEASRRDGSGRFFVGRPYLADGAPMVPSNQTVQIEMLSASSFAYKAHAVGRRFGDHESPIAPGTFSVFFHHGSAYGLKVVGWATLKLVAGLLESRAIALNEPLQGLVFNSSFSHDALRYWRLRYGGEGNLFGDDNVMERQKILQPTLVLTPTKRGPR